MSVGGRMDRLWEQVDAELDGAPAGGVERLLTRLGVPDHTARLLCVTPSLRLSWLGAVAVLLVAAALTARAKGAPAALLLLAPLLPVAGVSVAYGSGVDPTYELSVVAPLSGLRLTLLRTVAVLATTVPLTVLAGLAAGDRSLRAAAWLLPSLALTVLALCLQVRLGPLVGPVLVAAGWVALVLAAELLPQMPSPAATSAQLGFLVATVAGAGWLWAGRQRFETIGGWL